MNFWMTQKIKLSVLDKTTLALAREIMLPLITEKRSKFFFFFKINTKYGFFFRNHSFWNQPLLLDKKEEKLH